MMGLSWISPLYLSGLLLLALPVLIHLAQKQHSSGTRFPSLMFLRRIPQREKRRLEIRNWLLLMLRCLLLLLLVLAFARPFFAGGAAGALDPARSDSVIVLDRSYSMRIAGRWEQTRDIAFGLVDEKQASDRIGVVLFDDEAEVFSDLTTSADNLRTVLQRSSPGFRTTRPAIAIEQAARLLAGSDAGNKRIIVVSDFQASAPDIPIIPEDIEVTTLPVEVATAANAALTSVSVQPSSSDAPDEFALVVEVTNFADTRLEQEITLTLDGREAERHKLSLEPRAVRVKTFDRLRVTDDLLRGVASLDDDALKLDNQAYFIYSSQQQVPLLIVEGSSPRANQSVYLQNALRLSRDPLFRLERKPASALTSTDFDGRAAVILNDVAIPGGEAGDALAAFVARGGALLVATGEASIANWPGGNDGYLPGTPGHRVDASRGAAYRLTGFAPDHPLAGAIDSRDAIDLSLGRVFSYRAFEPGAEDRVVSRYDDGAVALLERRVGQGRVLVLTTTLDIHWNDLALQPAFLPFLHRGLRYLTAHESWSHQAEIGAIVDVMRYARALAGTDAIVAAAGDSPLVVEPPSANAIRVSRDSPLLALEEPGFYQVHQAAPAGLEVTLAVNIDPREAGQETLDVGRFVEEIRASAESAPAGAAPTRRQVAESEHRQQLWYTILSVVLALTLIEALSANWLGAKRSARHLGAGRPT